MRYSVRDRWFEVVDDGIGMDLHTIENSFLEIGQDKLDVIGRGERDTQIGYFGIGILSIFLVADKFEVGTKQFDSEQSGIRFEIAGIDENMTLLDNPYDVIGTYVRIFLRPDGNFNISSIPEYLSNYARHVDGVIIESVDDNQTSPLLSRWATDGFDNIRDSYNLPGVSSLRLAFSPALRKNSGALASEITICNAGFLAETAAHDLLPLPSIGLVGEVDLLPNTLTMSMSEKGYSETKLGRNSEYNSKKPSSILRWRSCPLASSSRIPVWMCQRSSGICFCGTGSCLQRSLSAPCTQFSNGGYSRPFHSHRRVAGR